jgi:hypothetical protein
MSFMVAYTQRSNHTVSEQTAAAGAGDEWTPPTGVNSDATSGSPSLTVFKNSVYAAWNQDGQLSISAYNPNGIPKWPSPTQPNGASNLEDGPALSAFTLAGVSSLVCVYRNGKSLYYTKSADGITWDFPQQITVSGRPAVQASEYPALCQFNNLLYCFHQGSDAQHSSNGQIWYCTWNGTSWTQHLQITTKGDYFMTSGPAAVEWQGQLWVYHQGVRGNGELWVTRSTDGTTWSADDRVSWTDQTNNLVYAHISAGPAVAVLDDTHHYICYQGPHNNGELWYLTCTEYAAGQWAYDFDKTEPHRIGWHDANGNQLWAVIDGSPALIWGAP